jgi:hypothetical protein
MVCELLAWMQMLALADPARCWEPKRVRLRVFIRPGSRSAATAFSDCTWPPLALVRIYHRRDHPPGGPRAWLTSPNRPFEQRNLPWPVEPAHPARQGAAGWVK